jgi:hypothetical protein
MILHLTNARLIDPDRKSTRKEMRLGGMVAAAVLVFIAVFTVVIVWIA